MTLLFILAIGALALSYGLVYGRSARIEPPPTPFSWQGNPAVSLIICARNEASALAQNVSKWLSQEGVDLQLILVNDHSSDLTAAEAKRLSAHHSNLTYVELSSPVTAQLGKKHAILQGLKYVRNPLIAFSDADCWPATSRTLRLMAQPFCHPSVQAVLGFAPVASGSQRLLQKLQEIDNALTAIQMSNYARKGQAYMALGRNVMYRAEHYNPNALAKSMKFLAGDDDLAFQAMSLSHVELVSNPRAHVFSPPCASWKAWFRQKRRHYSVVPGYRGAAVGQLSFLRVAQMAVIGAAGMGIWAEPLSAALALGAVWLWGFGLMSAAVSNYHLPLRKAELLLEPLRFSFVILVSVSLVFKPIKSW
jgi:cellulose synthase/poly-beta-1,6-N-acetylglucosamine synthase-like glycosyltransferase